MTSTQIERFDFEGLSDKHVRVHEKHGPIVQAHRFILWAGWTNSREVFNTHLQPGDHVEISTRSEQGKHGALPTSERWLTKRGVRRLLMRSNHPRAIEYTDKVMDLLELVDKAESVGVEVVEALHEAYQNRIEGIVAGAQRIQDRTDREVKLQLDSERSKREETQYQLNLYQAYVKYLRGYADLNGTAKGALSITQFRVQRFD